MAATSHHSLFEWSGWAFGLFAVLYVVFSEFREARKQRQLRRVAVESEPYPAIRSAADEERFNARQPAQLEQDRVRSVLIQVAVDGLSFSHAVDRLRRFGVEPSTVESAAQDLRVSKLLRFNEPLAPGTKLRLS